MKFPEVIVNQPDSFEDHRGSLYTLYNDKTSDIKYNHDKVSISKKHVLRGLHGDFKSTKLITCLAGEIHLVVVDFRSESENFLEWDAVNLTPENKIQVIVPPRFLTGHLILSEGATFFYKWSYEGAYPDVEEQISVKWDDKDINIDWPITNPILSERDK